MLTLRLNRALLALAGLIFAVSAIVNVITYGGLLVLPYIQWFSGAAGLIISGGLLVLMLVSISQARSTGWQLPAVKGLWWIMLSAVAIGVYGLYNFVFAWVQSTPANPLPSHLYSIRNESITLGLLELLASNYLYRLITWQRSHSQNPPAPQTGINTP
ncbi:MAG: hypothetical protein M3Z04_01960 [Chloroflexota bacterium]|nr:hypothetical protein [Chloroflexota bacterium]